MESSKVVHVHFKKPHEGMTDLYFGSLKAIYLQVPDDIIGINTSRSQMPFAAKIVTRINAALSASVHCSVCQI